MRFPIPRQSKDMYCPLSLEDRQPSQCFCQPKSEFKQGARGESILRGFQGGHSLIHSAVVITKISYYTINDYHSPTSLRTLHEPLPPTAY